jgi:hypothetical protein
MDGDIGVGIGIGCCNAREQGLIANEIVAGVD